MKKKLTVFLLRSYGFRDRVAIVQEAIQDLGPASRETFLNFLVAQVDGGKHIHSNPKRKRRAEA